MTEDCFALGLPAIDFEVHVGSFDAFTRNHRFPLDYHGGPDGGVWKEKFFEHYIARPFFGLENFSPGDRYSDVASSTSSWARILREQSLQTFNADLEQGVAFEALDY